MIFQFIDLTACLGPSAYAAENVNLDASPAFTFGVKTEKKIRSDSPAPNMYNPEKCNQQHQPAFSFGVKSNLEKPNMNPGKLEEIYSKSCI